MHFAVRECMTLKSSSNLFFIRFTVHGFTNRRYEDLCSFRFYEYNSPCDWCGEVLKDRLLFWAAFFLRHSVHVLLKRPYSSMAGTHLAHTLTVKPVKCLGTDSEVCEGSWRRFLGVCELFDSWSSKSVLRVPGLPVVRPSLDFLLCCMFLLFHVCDCNIPLVTHFRSK